MLYLGNNPIAGLIKPIAARNIGEIVASSLPLTDAGLHLLDGSLIQGGGIYQGFVDYIADLYDSTSVSGYKLNVNVTGSVINNNGVLSNFSSTNYTKMSNIFNPSGSSWEAVFKVTTPSSFGTRGWLWGGGVTTGADYQGVTVGIETSGKTLFWISSNGSSWDVVNGALGVTALTVNTEYYFKLEFTGTSYIMSISTDNETWTVQNTINSSVSAYVSSQPMVVGGSFYSSANAEYWKGSIDFKESFININGQRWWTGAEAMKPCFCTESEWQASITQYGVCGKFVYDSVNNTVRLPKITGIIEGTVDANTLGDLVEAGLPNITGNAGIDSASDYSGPFYSRGSLLRGTGADNNANYAGFDLSLANPIYGNSSTVQPQTIKAFYYIVIANSTKTEIQSDIDEIATDLNGKADVDLSNINVSGILKIAKEALGSIHYDPNDFTKIGAYWYVADLRSGTVSLPPNGLWLTFLYRYNASGTASEIGSQFGVGINSGGDSITASGSYPHWYWCAIRIKE